MKKLDHRSAFSIPHWGQSFNLRKRGLNEYVDSEDEGRDVPVL